MMVMTIVFLRYYWSLMKRTQSINFMGLALFLLWGVGCTTLREETQVSSSPNRDDSYVNSAVQQSLDVRAIYLSAGDEIRISVYGRSELNRQVVVPPDGRIFFPFLGDIDVAGRTVEQLRKTISNGLAEESSRVLSAGDLLAVQVFRRPELQAESIIPQAGMFPVPLIGNVQVVGLTPTQASERIAEELRRYVRDPQVMSRVVKYGGALPVSSPQVAVDLIRLTGERFFVLGEVRAPGVYPLVGQVSILDAVAAAGGPMQEAKSGSVLLIRAGGSGRPAESTKIDLDNAMRDGSGATIVLGRGDVVYVPESSISQVARFARSISDILRPIIDIETGVWLGQNIDEGPSSRQSQDATTRTVVVDR